MQTTTAKEEIERSNESRKLFKIFTTIIKKREPSMLHYGITIPCVVRVCVRVCVVTYINSEHLETLVCQLFVRECVSEWVPCVLSEVFAVYVTLFFYSVALFVWAIYFQCLFYVFNLRDLLKVFLLHELFLLVESFFFSSFSFCLSLHKQTNFFGKISRIVCLDLFKIGSFIIYRNFAVGK